MVTSPLKANVAMLKKLLVFTLIMFAFGYALVPFYEKFCEVTGINNLLKPDVLIKENWVDEGRWITVEFDANTRGLPYNLGHCNPAPVFIQVRQSV